MTPQETYNKALTIPVGEWHRFIKEAGFFDFNIGSNGNIQIVTATYVWVEISNKGVVRRGSKDPDMKRIIAFIECYAPPAPELVWEEKCVSRSHH